MYSEMGRVEFVMEFAFTYQIQKLILLFQLTFSKLSGKSRLLDMSLNINYNADAQMESEINIVEELQLIHQDFEARKAKRREKLETIKVHLSSRTQHKLRKTQNLFLYLLNLALPVTLSYFNAYVLLDLQGDQQLKGYFIDIFVCLGFITSIVSNLLIAPWRQVLKLYLLIDSLVPVVIASTIGFYAIHDFFNTGDWYQNSYYFIFPFWVFYFSGSIRVMIAYLDWSRWKILLYKLSVLASGLIFFYVGFTYMRGGYKITGGHYSKVEERLKNAVYLYVFGLCEFFFEYFKKLSDFDQTDQLKFVYEFKDKQEEKDNKIRQEEANKLRVSLMNEQAQEEQEIEYIQLKLLPKISRFTSSCREP